MFNTGKLPVFLIKAISSAVSSSPYIRYGLYLLLFAAVLLLFFSRRFRRVMIVLVVTLALLFVSVFSACLVLTHGPSSDARSRLVRSLDETSALKFLPYWFLPAETVESILERPEQEFAAPDTFRFLRTEPEAGEEYTEPEDDPLVVIDGTTVTDEVEVIDIRKATFKGKMLIVHDPSRVVVGTLERWGGAGWYLSEFVERYDALAGTNAGSFEDPNGGGSGGIPDGLVMKDGAISYGSRNATYNGVIGFDADHVMHVGRMTGQEALDLGLVTAVSFPPGPTLIKDGVKQTGLGGGVNPRTCVGQRADGAVLILVVEGRHPDSIGATYDDLADLMEEYGAVNAGNLDGGSSSAMIYEGEQITHGSNLIGSRPIATAILVLREGENEQ
ncbi:MAG: phosphodiester glycosidase family protein [Oscillospiraceae bacterium]|nr:phosphodiester glycosidase family protein [Oscillospiraceae bacterium]